MMKDWLAIVAILLIGLRINVAQFIKNVDFISYHSHRNAEV